MLNEKIWMNGKYLDRDKGRINVSTAALHYGTSIFEGILCIATASNRRAIFRLQEHIDRLFESGQVLDFEIAYSKEEFSNIIINLVKINKYNSCYIRPIIFQDIDYLNLGAQKENLNIAILCKKFNTLIYQLQMKKEVKVLISERVRNFWTNNLAKAKVSGKYLNSFIAKIEAREGRFDDAILLNEKGMVSEATASNIFIVKDGVIKTPRRNDTLNGITQNSVIEIARDIGYIVIEQDIKVDELYRADEIFLTNTARGIVSVYQVNSRKIIDSNQKCITTTLRGKYIDIIRGKDPKYHEWLTYILL